MSAASDRSRRLRRGAARGEVVRHDGVDTYVVVAADNGTATFSDTANAIPARFGFWLGEVLASGGSAGYDHKKVGICRPKSTMSWYHTEDGNGSLTTRSNSSRSTGVVSVDADPRSRRRSRRSEG